MKITGYLYALGVAGLLTYVVSTFYKVTNVYLQGILLTLLYIFIVHFGQGDHCLINGLKGINPMYRFKKSDDLFEKKDHKNNAGESFGLNDWDSMRNNILSTPNLNSRVHANDLYEDNPLLENRLESTPENNMYYALSNQYYPMNSRNQINQMDCTNDGSCLIPEDAENMHPVRQSLGEVLPVPNIGPQEKIIMNRLSPTLNASQNYPVPVPVEANHSFPSADIRTYYKAPTKTDDSCGKCKGPSNNVNNNNIVEGFENKKEKEMFGLFDTYDMAEHTEPLYINAPSKSSGLCKNCTVGYCQGDVCSTNPTEQFTRSDPMGF